LKIVADRSQRRRHEKRAIALVSGGLDSVVSLAEARERDEVRLVLFVDYGQRAVTSEREAVLAVVNYYGLPFKEVALPWLAALAPEGMRAGGAPAALDSLDAVWIPNRNGIFLNVAAAFAESFGCDLVVTGFNREEAQEFADNSAEYVDRVNSALTLSTRNGVQVVSYTIDLDKTAILERGAELRAPLGDIWSCYHAGPNMCGTCASCRRLVAAIEALEPAERPRLEFAA